MTNNNPNKRNAMSNRENITNKTGHDVLSIEDCLELGFEKLPHFTVANNLIYELGRNRHLSIGCVGTPNEMLFICERDKNDYRKITDLVCLHNYDYDSYLSKSKLQTLISSIGVSDRNTNKQQPQQNE